MKKIITLFTTLCFALGMMAMTCVEAAQAALSVGANNDLYNNGAVYTIEGYVTSIKTAYSDQYHNISFWIADTQDGGEMEVRCCRLTALHVKARQLLRQ